MSIKLTAEIFIIRANIIHKEKYDYSLVEYINREKKVKIICPIHGVFEQLAGNHLQGRGCPKCSGNSLKNTKQFIEEAIKKYGNKYEYKKTIYVNAITNVIITCTIHGDFEQTPHNHLLGNSCQICAGNIKKDTCQFVKEAIIKHGNIYRYEKVNYINNHTKIIITCLSHGDFEQTPSGHLSGQGCIICSGNVNKSTSQFIKEAVKKHKNIYRYEKVIYINAITKVIITCSIHGDFEQTPPSHLSGCGCQICAGNIKKRHLSICERSYNKTLE